jgi:hypothetical protein
MSVKPFALVVLILLVTLTGCRESAQQQSTNAASGITIDIKPDFTARVGETALTVVLTDAQGAPVDGATVRVRGDMNHAGMVPVNAETRESSGGEYVLPFQWTMGGDWIVTVEATLAGGGVVTRTFDYAIAR